MKREKKEKKEEKVERKNERERERERERKKETRGRCFHANQFQLRDQVNEKFFSVPPSNRRVYKNI